MNLCESETRTRGVSAGGSGALKPRPHRDSFASPEASLGAHCALQASSPFGSPHCALRLPQKWRQPPAGAPRSPRRPGFDPADLGHRDAQAAREGRRAPGRPAAR